MKASTNAIKLIEDSEGIRLKPYLCSAGVPTIGIGTTIYENGSHVKLTDPPITKERAYAIMFHQLIDYENAVNRYVKVKLNQNQFDALIDFSYNEGIGALQTSNLLQKVNKGDFIGASEEFKKWIYSNGKKTNGLITRRANDKALFLKPIQGV